MVLAMQIVSEQGQCQAACGDKLGNQDAIDDSCSTQKIEREVCFVHGNVRHEKSVLIQVG